MISPQRVYRLVGYNDENRTGSVRRGRYRENAIAIESKARDKRIEHLRVSNKICIVTYTSHRGSTSASEKAGQSGLKSVKSGS